jgi:hypothetical protein
VILWDSAGGASITELMGGLTVLFEVSSALTEETPMDHATFNGVMASLLTPLAHFFVLSEVSYCRVQLLHPKRIEAIAFGRFWYM